MQRGFTLIEMLVTVAIMALLAISVGDSILSLFKAETAASNGSYSTASAQGALGAMVGLVREMNYGINGQYPIVSMSGNSLTFLSDNGNGSASKRFTFQLIGASLVESVTSSSGNPPQYSGTPIISEIADDVQNIPLGLSLFHYFDAAGNEITDFSKMASTSSILIDLNIGTGIVQTPGYKAYTLQSLATLRNLRSE